MSSDVVVPVVQTLSGPVAIDMPAVSYDPRSSTLSAPALAPMTKWAGEPGDGSFMGGTNNGGSADDNYDPHKKPSPYAEVGASGLAQYGGFVHDEFLPQLQGDKGLKAMREMYDNDSIIGALVFAIQMMIRKVEWRVEPPVGASVEEIVDARIAERQQREAEHQQKQQMQMASMIQPSPTQTGPGGQPAAPSAASGPTASRATPLNQAGPPSQPIRKRVRSLFRKSSSFNIGMPQPTEPSDDDPSRDISEDPLMNDTLANGGKDLTPEERKAEELAVFVETCFHDMSDSWADTLAQIVTMIVFGFSFHEVVYKKRSGVNLDNPDKSSRFDDARVGWAKLAGRAQETRHRWEFDDNGNAIGMWQLAPPKFKLRYIPFTKGLLFRTTAYKGNPEGRSLFRSAYRSWYFKRRAEEYEAIGLERDLAGIPVAYVPYQMMTTGATEEEKAALEEIKKIVRNLRVNEQNGVVFPMALDPETKQPLYSLELLSSPSRRQFDTDKIITRYEQRQAMTVLADFILLGHESVGSRALGETKADLFTTVLEAILNAIADVINTHAIPRLLQMNGEDPALAPKLTFGKLKQVALADVAAVITAMANAGADLFPDEHLEDTIRGMAGLPVKVATDDL